MELTARAPAAESVASEPVSAVEHVAEDLDPGATEFADGAGSDSCEYDDCECVQCRPGWRRFRRRPKPVVCYHDRPFGWYLRNAYQQQIARGFQDQMVLYHYDFQAGAKADQLSSRGRQQLAKFAQIVDSHGFPVVIQPTNGRPELDAARQAHVAMELSTMTESATEPAVIVAQPRAPGMRGSEALEIDKNLMQQTQQRGLLMRGAGGGGGFGFAGAGIETGLSGGSSE
ncbi:MAG: hypothetical protein GTO53_03880 [Planctomycetales bacterium]|nr:hypothetical protein [Planctomycetales bacterium]NIM08301.1 hypothetical protein [Planctomycetales bacterium]NIN08567.1 hypothetical protein [Planctomycetales bacterium]NIN76912.1 hypothetical protein [Planctomycetales bacterium]NIO34865.1 hypothetical protein [Planctomycetales bacterium]